MRIYFKPTSVVPLSATKLNFSSFILIIFIACFWNCLCKRFLYASVSKVHIPEIMFNIILPFRKVKVECQCIAEYVIIIHTGWIKTHLMVDGAQHSVCIKYICEKLPSTFVKKLHSAICFLLFNSVGIRNDDWFI